MERQRHAESSPRTESGHSRKHRALSRGLRERVVGLVGAVLVAHPAAAVDFEYAELDVHDYRLDDIGVVDVDSDGNLDIFTTNHNGAQSLLFGAGDGSFANVNGESVGLVQNPDAPGLTDSDRPPELSEEGLYVYLLAGRLNIRRVGLDHLGPVEGAFHLHYVPEVAGTGTVEPVVCDDAVPYRCRVHFTLGPDAHLAVGASIYQRPKRLVLDPDLPLEQVFLGPTAMNPSAHDMTLRLKDRHGMAWADVDGNGELDVYISSGGARGQLDRIMADHPGIDLNNELFCQRAGMFEPCSGITGLVKDYDRGRGVAWVDFDQSGRLDLFVNNHETSNRLFRRKASGAFNDRAPAQRLAKVTTGPFVWFDADADGDADLLMTVRDSIVLKRRGEWNYEKETVGPYLGGLKNWSHGKMSLHDLDGDGLLEVIVASPRGSSLVTNDGGRLTAWPAAQFGLPARSYSLDAVDIDNDGVPEVFAVTRDCVGDGIYKLKEDGRFALSELWLSLRGPECTTARSLWFDADNNGFLDLLLARQTSVEAKRDWDTVLLRNLGNANGWLQVRLVGPPANPQALGARVIVRAGGREWLREVGQSEGARFSQGHFRLYFGLGAEQTVETLEVLWLDGTVTTLSGLEAGRLVTVYHAPTSS